MFGGNFAPAGYAQCAGQLMSISDNDALFNLIGTTYGGDGQSTFALPDLRGRVAVCQGQGPGLSSYLLGQAAGVETVTLTTQQLPIHNHSATVVEKATSNTPSGSAFLANEVLGQAVSAFTYAPFEINTKVSLASNSVSITGGGQPHENVQPVLAMTYCIALYGVYPSQN